MQYLLDTNTVWEVIRIVPDKLVVTRWEKHLNETSITSITWHELLYGVQRMTSSRRRDQHEAFLADLSSRLPILPYEQLAAEWHAFQRARLVKMGRTPPYEDGQIAAIAAVNQLVLVTANTSDFQYFEGLKIENWAKRR